MSIPTPSRTSFAIDTGPRASFVCIATLVFGFLLGEQATNAEFIREYDFVRFGEVTDFIPKQLAYSSSGELLVFGAAGTVNTVSGSGSNIGRWTSAGGVEEILATPLFGNIFVHDVSQDGSVVVGRRSFISESGFRWTAAGGYETLTNPGAGWANGVSSDGTAIGGFDTQPGVRAPIVWEDITSPTELQGSEESYFVSDVEIDDSGNIWATGGLLFSSGGDSVVWRNGEIVFDLDEAFQPPSAEASIRIARTPTGIKALMRLGPPTGTVTVDFPNADPNTPVVNQVPLRGLEMTSDGSMLIGTGGDFLTGPLTSIFAPGPNVWGTESNGFALVGSLLEEYLPVDKQQEVDLGNWQFRQNESGFLNSFIDIAVHRDSNTTHAALLARGQNPDGQLESYLVTLEATPIPEPSAIAILLIATVATMVARTGQQIHST